jgi:hypothetical protein
VIEVRWHPSGFGLCGVTHRRLSPRVTGVEAHAVDDVEL